MLSMTEQVKPCEGKALFERSRCRYLEHFIADALLDADVTTPLAHNGPTILL